MKKRILSYILALLIPLLAACGAQQPEATQSEITTAPTTQPAQPALPTGDSRPEDLVFFANPLEYSRLYAYDVATKEAYKILDMGIYQVRQYGTDVYYKDGNTLYYYDIATGDSLQIGGMIGQYFPLNGGVAYCMLGTGYEDEGVFYYHRASGEHRLVAESAFHAAAACGDMIYYSRLLEDPDRYMLYAYDVTENKEKPLCPDVHGYGMYAWPEGVIVDGFEEPYYGRYYVDLETGTPTRMPYLQGSISEPLKRMANGFYYICSRFEDFNVSYELRFYSDDGEDVAVLKDVPHMFSTAQLNGNMLFTAQHHEPWGDKNAYGHYDNFACLCEFYLLTNSGRLEEIEIIGESGTVFADGEFPLIDSSTARKPVTAELYSLFVEGYKKEGNAPICSTTHGAWLNIADRKADLAFLAAPTAEEQAYLQEKGVEVEMKLYGGDGLVFIKNEKNPVTDLSREQILGIYTGQITNWSEVGGPDQPIRVFYRDPQSGSQRLFESLVFAGADKPDYEALGFELEGDMSSIVDMVAEDPWSIGYSIMTYLESVYATEGVEILSVDQVLPSPETVASSAYAYHTKGYIVIRKDEPEGSPARRLYDWFGCPMSDELLTRCNVSPLRE